VNILTVVLIMIPRVVTDSDVSEEDTASVLKMDAVFSYENLCRMTRIRHIITQKTTI
jgi:hypothetical protein